MVAHRARVRALHKRGAQRRVRARELTDRGMGRSLRRFKLPSLSRELTDRGMETSLRRFKPPRLSRPLAGRPGLQTNPRISALGQEAQPEATSWAERPVKLADGDAGSVDIFKATWAECPDNLPDGTIVRDGNMDIFKLVGNVRFKVSRSRGVFARGAGVACVETDHTPNTAPRRLWRSHGVRGCCQHAVQCPSACLPLQLRPMRGEVVHTAVLGSGPPLRPGGLP